jgi:solute carrier family 8 (sodium/calcium exchanger)
VEAVLKPTTLLPRIAYKRQFGNRLAGKKDLKGVKIQEDGKSADDLPNVELNQTVGFKCLHYSVTESAGTVKISIIKKTDHPLTIGVRTVDDTAISGEDYNGIDKQVNFTKDQKEITVEVGIIDDDEWEPDEDFLCEIYDCDTGKKLEGQDTSTRITIIDDDEPGVLSFAERHVKAKVKDKFVVVKVIRQNGCDGVRI